MTKYTMKQARQLAGLTQAQAASMIGVSCATYRSYEIQGRNVRMYTLVRFSEATKIPIEQIAIPRDFGLDLTEKEEPE